MASDTKQQSTYKKRVISESDDEDSDSGAEGNVPLSARGADATAQATAPELAKSNSNESNHNPQDIAAGSVILKEAAGSEVPNKVSFLCISSKVVAEVARPASRRSRRLPVRSPSSSSYTFCRGGCQLAPYTYSSGHGFGELRLFTQHELTDASRCISCRGTMYRLLFTSKMLISDTI